jgi:hypothetical protein
LSKRPERKTSGVILRRLNFFSLLESDASST